MKPTSIFVGAACAVMALTCAPARATTINFSGLANGTTVTTQYAGVVFSLAGGPDSSGSPTIWNYAGAALANSNNSDYPTANILNVAFSAPVSNLSFTFDNYTNSGGGAATTYTAYNAADDVVATGNLQEAGAVSGGFDLFTVAGSGITDLQFNNNNGEDSWYYAVQTISYTGGVPEPSTWALMLMGLAGLGAVARRQARKSAAQSIA
jgi:hypothetical protein